MKVLQPNGDAVSCAKRTQCRIIHILDHGAVKVTLIFYVYLQKLEKSDLDNWENIRGPQLWEDSRAVQQQRREAARLKTEWSSKPTLLPAEKVSGWTILFFIPLSGADMGGQCCSEQFMPVCITVRGTQKAPCCTKLFVCIHLHSSTGCMWEFSIKTKKKTTADYFTEYIRFFPFPFQQLLFKAEVLQQEISFQESLFSTTTRTAVLSSRCVWPDKCRFREPLHDFKLLSLEGTPQAYQLFRNSEPIFGQIIFLCFISRSSSVQRHVQSVSWKLVK